MDHLDLTQPSVSKHLRTLREAGLVSARGDKQQRIHRLEPAPLKAIDDWLGPYRRRWAQALDALGRHLDSMDDAGVITELDPGRVLAWHEDGADELLPDTVPTTSRRAAGLPWVVGTTRITVSR